MKKIVLVLSVLLSVCGVKAQEVSVGADVVSSYVWRGLYQGGGASIQPGITFTTGSFSVGTWGSSNFTGGNKEVDLTVGYEVAGLSLAITDYWWEGEDVFDYFNYGDTHHFEASVGYTLPESFPLSLSWNTLFAGADDNSKGKQAYSTYIEAGYPFTVKDIPLEVAIGITPWDGLYADKFAVSTVSLKASKEIKITDSFSLPVFGQFILNPEKEGIYLVVGVSF
jgi:hypothetical protein